MTTSTGTGGPAFVLRGTAENWELTLDVKRVAAVLGDDVLAHFYKCFVASDRIVALEHLLYLNHKHGVPDSIAHARNLHHLVLLLVGAMYEAGAALQGLTSSPFGKTLQTLKSWKPLNEMRGAWHTDAFASRIRSGFAHHFGEISTYRAGIAKGPETAVVETGLGSTLLQSRVVEPWDALLRGEDLQDAQLSTFVKKSLDAHTKFPDLIRELFNETLVAHGIEFRNEQS